MYRPLFSVVIPTYNRADLIAKAIDSVINQSFTDWELIVADDCSTDTTISLVREKYVDQKIKVYRNIQNGGNAAARNLGVNNSTGEYVCFLDSDDAYHPDYLEKMSRLIEDNNSPGFLWCNVNRVSEHGIIKPNTFPKHWKPLEVANPYHYFLKGIYFGTDFGLTVRRDCFDSEMFDENLRVAVDTDLILRLVRKFNFAYTNEILVDTLDHSGARVRTGTNQKAHSYSIIIDKHPSVWTDKKLFTRWNYKLMWLNYHSNHKKEARKYLTRLVKAGELKPSVLGLIFEALPNKLAISIHKKISAI